MKAVYFIFEVVPCNNADNFLLQDNARLLFLHLILLRELFVFHGLNYTLKYKPSILPFLFHITYYKQLMDGYFIPKPSILPFLFHITYYKQLMDGYFIPKPSILPFLFHITYKQLMDGYFIPSQLYLSIHDSVFETLSGLH